MPKSQSKTLIGLLLCLLFAISQTGFCEQTQTQSPADPLDILKQAQAKFEKVNDYTAIFIKKQRFGDKFPVEEQIYTKFKKPFAIYYKWITPDSGKEVIYVDGKNNNKLIAHLGGAISLFPISKWLSPTDPLAMNNNKHPITRSGIGNMINSLIAQYELAKSNNELSSFYLGSENLDGKDTIVIGRRLPNKDQYSCYLSIVNIDKETGIPIRVISYNWDYNLEEAYYYKNVKINQGLTDKDFDPNNGKYRFGLIKF